MKIFDLSSDYLSKKRSLPAIELRLHPVTPQETSALERIVTEVVSEQSYRRSSQHLETIGNIPVSHTRLHRWVMKSDCDKIDAKKKVQTIIADGTGYKRKPVEGSNRGEVRLVVGVTKDNVWDKY